MAYACNNQPFSGQTEREEYQDLQVSHSHRSAGLGRLLPHRPPPFPPHPPLQLQRHTDMVDCRIRRYPLPQRGRRGTGTSALRVQHRVQNGVRCGVPPVHTTAEGPAGYAGCKRKAGSYEYGDVESKSADHHRVAECRLGQCLFEQLTDGINGIGHGLQIKK